MTINTDKQNIGENSGALPSRGSVVWKIGLILFFLGVLMFGIGPYFLGTALVKSVQSRKVSSHTVSTGGFQTLSAITVDPSLGSRIVVHTVLELPDAVIEEERERADIVRYNIQANYKILSEDGENVHMGSGPLTGSTILSEQTSPHYNNIDREVTCSHRSETFNPPTSGTFDIEIFIASNSGTGWPVSNATVEIYDQIPMNAGAWGASGLILLVVSPILSLTGYITFAAGFVAVRIRKARSRELASPEPMQIISLIWGLLALLGMLTGLIPLLGWFNCINIPFSVGGGVLSIISLCTGKDRSKTDPLVGLACCITAVFLGIVRWVIGFGVI